LTMVVSIIFIPDEICADRKGTGARVPVPQAFADQVTGRKSV
jgi:hypothetical protein